MTKKSSQSQIIERYAELFEDRFQIKPKINFGQCGKMIKSLLADHSAQGVIRIIELYFEKEKTTAYHLPWILSAASVNKYLPMMKLDPMLFADAEEHNKEIY